LIRPRSIGWRFRVKPFDSVDGEPTETALTKTTITACPSAVKEEESFNIRGKLVVKETNSPIEAGNIKFSYDSVSMGSDLTDANGVFTRQVKIPKAGSWNVSARFDSVPGKFGPSSDNKTVTVSKEAAPPEEPPAAPPEEPPAAPPGEEPPPPEAPPCPFRLQILCRIWRMIYG